MGTLLHITKTRAIASTFIILAVIYMVQTFFTGIFPTDSPRYGLNEAQLRTINFMLALPFILIWAIAYRGYRRLSEYTQTIKGERDGFALSAITNGICILALWLPLYIIMNNLVKSMYDANPALAPLLVQVENYANVVVLGIGFVLLFIGGRRLKTLIPFPRITQRMRAVIAVVAGLFALYVPLVFNDPSLRIAVAGLQTASYYQPDWLIFASLVMPRIVTWLLGVWTVITIYMYAKQIGGDIYRRSLSGLAYGLGTVIASIIAIAYIQSVSVQLVGASLGMVLLIIFALLVLLAIGFVLIAHGAKNLQRIEEV